MTNFKPAEPAGFDSDQPEPTFGKFPVIRKPLRWEFVIRRHESRAAQLTDEQEGYVPGLRQRK